MRKIVVVVLFLGICYAMFAYVHHLDFEESMKERRFRSELLNLRDTLDLQSSTSTSLIDIVNDTRKDGGLLQFNPNSENLFPDFLSDENKYIFYHEKRNSPECILIRSEFKYFLRKNKVVCLYWDGSITDSPSRGDLKVK